MIREFAAGRHELAYGLRDPPLEGQGVAEQVSELTRSGSAPNRFARRTASFASEAASWSRPSCAPGPGKGVEAIEEVRDRGGAFLDPARLPTC